MNDAKFRDVLITSNKKFFLFIINFIYKKKKRTKLQKII